MRRVSFFLWAACLLNAVSLYGTKPIKGSQNVAITGGEVGHQKVTVSAITGGEVGHQKVTVSSSKRRFGRGAKSHRDLIEQYQEKWNESPNAFDTFFKELNQKQQRSILRHSIKIHGEKAAITQQIERDMPDADKAKARKKTWRGHTSDYKQKARDHATRAGKWGQSKYNRIRNRE